MVATLGEIAARIGASINTEVKGMAVNHLLTDSRSLTEAEGTLFFALHTHTGDGHYYLQSLYSQGVRMFVVQHIPEQMKGMEDAVMIVVPDTLKALQLSCRPTERIANTMISVSGSRGKTIVKEWLHAALLSLGADAVRSPRSFNSQTGVPLSVWQIPEACDIAIIEAGISQPGEMQMLQQIVKPDIALYTGLDLETHLQGFENIEQKAHEKALMSSDARMVIYDSDNAQLAAAIGQTAAGRHIRWSRQDADAFLYIKEIKKSTHTTLIIFQRGNKEASLQIPFTADADIENIIAVVTTLMAINYPLETLRQAIGTLKPVRTRLDVVEGVNGCSVATDGYSADLTSLPYALDFMKRHSVRGQKLTLIMGDLQQPSDDNYRKLAELVKRGSVERFIAVGEGMLAHKKLLGENTQIYRNIDDLHSSLSVADFSGEYVMIKGNPGEGLERVSEMLAASKHETVLEVNLGALARNYAYYKSKLPEGTRLTAMVKASAYGMGSYEVSRTLQDAGADYLAVAVLDEGLELRRRGITMPIMVMNPKAVNYRSMFANRLEPEIYSLAMLQELTEEAARSNVHQYPVHIKLDTGMHRTGFEENELTQLCKILMQHDEIKAASVFSHLATADCVDLDQYTLRQIEAFGRMTDYMSKQLGYPFLRHILNSAGIIRFPEYGFDMARLGIGLYGVNTLPAPVKNTLEPVARLRTVIISLRDVAAGDAVGYGRRGEVKKNSRIATLPIGYADGFNRHFGCGAVEVYVNGQPVPTIGNICMDQSMIDVTGIDCAVGDEVEIFGHEAGIQRLADVLDTIPYEILTSISPRVKRLYYRE